MTTRNRAQGPCIAWRIENASGDEADVYIYDVIGDPWAGKTSADFVSELHDLKDVAKLNLHINSPGGYVRDAIAMYNAIQQHPATVTALIESEAASAASFVAMAADEVLIAKTAKFLIHEARGLVMGTAVDARALAEALDEESLNIASIYADRTGTPTDDWLEAMSANNGIGTTYRGQAAVDAGLADGIAPVPEKVRNSARDGVRPELAHQGGWVHSMETVAAQSDGDDDEELELPADFGREFRKSAAFPLPSSSPEVLEGMLARQQPFSQSLKGTD